eukprot:scaffold7093_cov73-Phaeocystis_antarctica.AAC.2
MAVSYVSLLVEGAEGDLEQAEVTEAEEARDGYGGHCAGAKGARVTDDVTDGWETLVRDE